MQVKELEPAAPGSGALRACDNREWHTALPAPAAGNNKGVKAGATEPLARQECSSEQLTFTELLPCALP